MRRNKPWIGEKNTVYKKVTRGYLRIGLVYPSTYQVSISSLAVNLLYYLLNSFEEVYAERIVFESSPKSIETGSHMREFDALLFSAHFELVYPDILKMIREAGIPLYARDRGNEYPILVVGGPAVSANPEPLADFFDVIVVGEAEPVIPKLVESLLEYHDDKRKLLEELFGEEGFYIPVYGKHVVRKAWVRDLDDAFHPIEEIQNIDVEPIYGRGYMVEVSRGCFRRCRFCLEGHVMLPKRDRSFPKVKRLVEEGLEANSLKRVIFYSLSFFDHRDADRILEYVVEDLGVEASIPSLRPDTLNDYRLELIVRAGQKTLTIAPETLSPRIARVLGKGFTYDYIRELSVKALSMGLKIKYYFIIGVPGEKREDIEAIPRLVNQVVKETGIRASESIRLSVNPLIPKPHTPLQTIGLEDPGILREKMKLIEKGLPKPVAVMDSYPPKWAVIQAAIALADRSISKTLAEWSMLGGGLGAWRRAVKRTNYSLDYVFRSRTPPYPWSHIVVSP